MADIFLQRRETATATPTRASSADSGILGGLLLDSAGAPTLYSDNFSTSITIGGGSSLTGAAAIKLDGGSGGVTVKSGATGDITFNARGMVTPLPINDATNKDLSGFTSGSVVGALNELKAASGGSSAAFADTLLDSDCDGGFATI